MSWLVDVRRAIRSIIWAMGLGAVGLLGSAAVLGPGFAWAAGPGSAAVADSDHAAAVAQNPPVSIGPVTSSSPVRAMTLEQALVYARGHQPSLRGALARVTAAAADTRVARAQWLPRFGLTLQAFEGTTNNSTASYLGVPEVAIPRIGATRVSSPGSWAPNSSTLGAIGAGQEIFDFGRIAAQSAVADVAYETERHRADSERLRVDLMVKEAYFGVQGARAVVRAAEDAYQRARLHRDMAAAEVKSGLHAPIEVTRAEADLTRFDVGRIRAEGTLRTAQAVFAAAVGVDDRTLDAAGQPAPGAPVPPMEEGLQQAIDRDPLLQEARSRVAGAQAASDAIAAELRPDLALTATFSGRAGSADSTSGPADNRYGPLPVLPNWDVGLVLRWPLYDPVVGARQKAAAARTEVARADVAVLSQAEAGAVQEAYLGLEIAQATLTSLDRAVAAARANYAQAEARFKAGLGTSLELADAEALRTDAEIQLAVGQFEALRTRAVLARLMAEGL
jgi:outer membrane protein